MTRNDNKWPNLGYFIEITRDKLLMRDGNRKKRGRRKVRVEISTVTFSWERLITSTSFATLIASSKARCFELSFLMFSSCFSSDKRVYKSGCEFCNTRLPKFVHKICLICGCVCTALFVLFWLWIRENSLELSFYDWDTFYPRNSSRKRFYVLLVFSAIKLAPWK